MPPPPSASGKKSKKAAKDAKAKGGVWQNWVRPILVVVAVVAVVRSSLIDWNDVPTGSMKTTIVEGDRIFVNKLAYGFKPPFAHGIPIPFTTTKEDPDGKHLNLWRGWRDAYWFDWGEPDRGDVVTFWSPIDGIRLVKRVVGVPGDTLRMTNCVLEINGETAQWEPLGPDPADVRFSLFRESVAGHSRVIRLLWNDAAVLTLASSEGAQQVEFVLRDGVMSIGGKTLDAKAFENQIKRVVQAAQAGQLGALTREQISMLERLQNMRTHARLSSFGPVTLGEDQFWMVGDNRDQSRDARSWALDNPKLTQGGAVHRRAIAGQAVRIAWSLDKGNFYLPRLGRTLKSLD
ncbi:MAG: signal peptidase I [Planctomycetota bacterium]